MSEESEFSEDVNVGWIQWFCGLEDHLFFCEVNEDFIKNEFNLYGLKKRVTRYQYSFNHSEMPSKWFSGQFHLLRKKSTILGSSTNTKISWGLPACNWTVRTHSCSLYNNSWGASYHEREIFSWSIRQLSQSYVLKAKCVTNWNQWRFEDSQSQSILSSVQGHLQSKKEVSRCRWGLFWYFFSLFAHYGTFASS